MRVKSQIVLLIFLGVAVNFGSIVANDQVPVEAPRLILDQMELPPRTGFIPPSMDLPHLDGQKLPEKFHTLTVPAQWDWRTSGKVTSVRDQSSCGSCYAFAALGTIESKMLIDGAGTYDFSENNAKECNWYGTSCDGGNYTKMASWFSKTGTVTEACDPYIPADTNCNSSCTYIKTLLDWRIISTGTVPADSVLKHYIYNYGPVYTALYAGNESDSAWSSEFSSYDGTYTLYYTGGYTPNHAVLIIGWDDDLSHAGGSGGWIIKNSWGTSWGGPCGYGAEGGYFTIAYGSANTGQYSSYMQSWQDYNSNGDIMYYDEGGWTTNWGYSSVTGWGLCKFVPSENTYLVSVEFWTNDATTDIDVYIYDDFDGSNLSTLLASKLNTSYDEAGYHSIALDSPLGLTSSDAVYAVVKFTNDSYDLPIAADDAGTNETATTYISSDGGSWYDLGAGQADDVAIRIRTSTVIGIDDESHRQLPDDFLLTQNYPNPFNAQTIIEYGLPYASQVKIEIYNILGRKVETLVNEHKNAGYHKANWNSKDNPSGAYFYRIKAGAFAETRMMVLIK